MLLHYVQTLLHLFKPPLSFDSFAIFWLFAMDVDLLSPTALSPQLAPSAAESCFARQHNISENNNQCFSGANGHLPSQLTAQRPGAIDNQSLVTTDPIKARRAFPKSCTPSPRWPVELVGTVFLLCGFFTLFQNSSYRLIHIKSQSKRIWGIKCLFKKIFHSVSVEGVDHPSKQNRVFSFICLLVDMFDIWA